MIFILGTLPFKDLKIATFIKDFIMAKFYFHFNILLSLQILSLWIRMHVSKQILKFVWLSHNIIHRNGIQPGLLEQCLKQLSVFSMKIFKESDMKKAHLNKESYSLRKVTTLNAINVESWKISCLQESPKKNKRKNNNLKMIKT